MVRVRATSMVQLLAAFSDKEEPLERLEIDLQDSRCDFGAHRDGFGAHSAEECIDYAEFAMSLAACRSLSSLAIACCPQMVRRIIGKALRLNSAVVSLEDREAQRGSMVHNDAALAVDALRNGSAIRSLSVTTHSELEVANLAEALKHNSTLQALYLTCKAGEPALITQALAEALLTNISLQAFSLELHLGRAPGAVEAALAFVEVLQANTPLRRFDLKVQQAFNYSNSGRVAVGVSEALAEALLENSALQAVSLELPRIGEAASSFARVLNTNKALKRFELKLPNGSNASTIQSSFIALVRALKDNTTAQSFKFGGPYVEVGADAALTLAECVEENRTLRSLSIKDQNFAVGKSAQDVLERAFKSNLTLLKVDMRPLKSPMWYTASPPCVVRLPGFDASMTLERNVHLHQANRALLALGRPHDDGGFRSLTSILFQRELLSHVLPANEQAVVFGCNWKSRGSLV